MKPSILSLLLLFAGFSAHASVTAVTCESVTGLNEDIIISSFPSKMPGYPGIWLKTTLSSVQGQNFEIDQSKVKYDNTGFVTQIFAGGSMGNDLEIDINQNLPDANNLSPATLKLDGKVVNIQDFRCDVTTGR